MYVQLMAEYYAYYKKDYHTSQKDYGRMVNYWKSSLAEEYQMASFEQEKDQRLS